MDGWLSAFFAADPATIAWPYDGYARLREGAGVVRWQGGPATVVTRYEDVKSIMRGMHPVRQDGYRFGELAERTISQLPVEHRDTFFRVLDFEGLFMARQDGESHARLRRIAARAFTARRIEHLRSSIQTHMDELMDEFERQPQPDVKQHLADKLPVRVITDLLGVPQTDREKIWGWSEKIARLFSLDATSLSEANRAIDEFRQYVGDSISRHREGGGTELAQLMLDSREDEVMTEDELVAMYLLLLFGGTETTTNLLGNGFLALQRHREQWDMLVSHPQRVRGAIEEMLRYDSPHQYLPRVATGEFEMGGHTFTPGETVIIIQAAANRDDSQFEQPDVFDIRRANSSDHLSFAFGPHHCLGAALARLEAEIFFNTLIDRYPRAKLLDPHPEYGGSAMLRSIQSLPTDLTTD